MSRAEMDNGHSMTCPIAIVKTGETFPEINRRFGDFERWIRDGLGTKDVDVIVVDPRNEAAMPDPAVLAGIVVSGSHAMLSDDTGWMRSLAAWLRQAVSRRIPLLGICFGHQILAQAMAGSVEDRVCGAELGTVEVSLTSAAIDDPLFGNLTPTFPAQVVHWQSVVELPERAIVLAHSPLEPYQAIRVGDCAWGVQFHPEMSEAVMHSYIDALAESVAVNEAVGRTVRQALKDTPVARRILLNFLDYAERDRAANGQDRSFPSPETDVTSASFRWRKP